MTSKDYISSGLLEAYVLGSLDESASEQVAGAMCRFPEVAAEVAALESMLIRGAELDAIAPPPDMQDRIWAAIESSGAADSAEFAELPAKAAEKPGPILIPFSGSPNTKTHWTRAAMLAVLLGSVAANVMLWSSKRSEERRTATLTQQISGMDQQQQLLSSRLDRYRQEAEMAARTDMQPVAMRSMQPGHPMAATMYWNKDKAEAFVSVQLLPPAPSGMQYQLWVIADGKPLSIGMLNHDVAVNGGMQKVPEHVASAQAFAVSLEREGGSPTPTADKIFLMGKMPV